MQRLTTSCLCCPPCSDRVTKFYMWGDVPDVIIQVKFDFGWFRGFVPWGSENPGFPLTRPIALTNNIIATVMHCDNTFCCRANRSF